MTDQPEKMPLTSMDIAAEKREALKQLFPEVFAEDRIDFDQLKRVLGDWMEPGKERFGLTWPGKADCMRIIQSPSVATLKPVREESVNFDETENVFIEGDNLEVLKLLQKAYFGKVKMIYIDPPYNTGGEFIYPDKYAETLDTYLAYTGQIDDEGRKFSTNSDAIGRYHSNWLNMMYPRLYLARNLLREDGLIFISIDDNEYDNLRKICDQIFGEEAFVASFIWKSRQNKDNRPEKGVSIDHEYIVCYGQRVRGDERKTEQYSNPDGDPRGPWASGNMVGLATKDRRPNLHYDLVDPDTGVNYGCPDMGWRYDQSTMARLIEEGRIIWPTSDNGRPRRKTFLNELSGEYTGTSSFVGEEIFTRNGTSEIKGLFGFRAMDFPKPVRLLRELIDQAISEGDIVLDFFAGSASTGHAVFEHNVNSSDNRCSFVLVQLPEETDASSEARNNGLDSISAIARERLRLSAEELKSTNIDGQLALDQIDLGFRAFSLTRSSFRQWIGTTEDVSAELDLHVQNVTPSATPEDIVYELLLKAGFPLTTKVKAQEMAGKTVYSVEEGSLLICLDKEITPALIDALADADPLQVICLDEGFKGNDQLKANAVQTFKARAASRETEIVFRTV